jgi:predicted small lipoprotein YifL
MRASLFLLGVLSLSACGRETYLPDGGRNRQVCSDTQGKVPVKVVDGTGTAIEAVDVTATHLGTGTVTSAKSDVNGNIDIVTDELGAGTIRVVAQVGAKRDTADVTVACGECLCTANPATVTLTIR